MAYISDYSCSDKNIDPKTIFRNEAKRLFKACEKVKSYKMFRYEKCYHAPKPSFFKMKKEGEVANFHEYKEFLKTWYSEHPEEYAREQESKRKADEEYARQFRIIYGIAKRHHVRLEWDGEDQNCCMPDRWEVYKNGKRIGRINMQCF